MAGEWINHLPKKKGEYWYHDVVAGDTRRIFLRENSEGLVEGVRDTVLHGDIVIPHAIINQARFWFYSEPIVPPEWKEEGPL